MKQYSNTDYRNLESRKQQLSTQPAKGVQSGFTIIELLIATAVFSVVMLIMSAGVLQISKMYYQGVLQARTQDTSRAIIEEIGESIRYTTGTYLNGSSTVGPDIAVGSPDTGYFCLGNRRYTYAIDRQLKAAPAANTKQKLHALWVDQPVGGCSLSTGPENLDAPAAGGRELLSENMRLTRFSVEPVTAGGIPDGYTISVSVAYGDDDLLYREGSELQKRCDPASGGKEFCAISTLVESVTKRL